MHLYKAKDQALHLCHSSYQPITWFAKPDSISPLQCARWGWHNSANDELLCKRYIVEEHSRAGRESLFMPAFFGHAHVLFLDSCNAMIRHELEDHDGSHLSQQMSTGHTSICPWRDNPCPESFTQVVDIIWTRVAPSAVGLKVNSDVVPGEIHRADHSRAQR